MNLASNLFFLALQVLTKDQVRLRSGFPLHYVAMAWPLWRCGLALCVGFLVRLFARQLPIRHLTLGLITGLDSGVGPIGALPLSVLNLVTAILAVIYFNEAAWKL